MILPWKGGILVLVDLLMLIQNDSVSLSKQKVFDCFFVKLYQPVFENGPVDIWHNERIMLK